MNIHLTDLKKATLPKLESLYSESSLTELPASGLYRGIYLQRLTNREAYKPHIFFPQKLLFDWIPFGIRFSENWGDWFFFNNPNLAFGTFNHKIGNSRWRKTQAVTMNYENSKLPFLIKNLLYDEVKPLSEDLILGIGGTNQKKGNGDHFFFALMPF